MPLIERIRAKNLLSFGEDGLDLELRDLNVVIGPNSSGKSNLISLFSLLQAAPTDITRPLSTGGGIREWLWKGDGPVTAEIEAFLHRPEGGPLIQYSLSFREEAQRFYLVDERIGEGSVFEAHGNGFASLRAPTKSGAPARSNRTETVASNHSVLSQRRGPRYPEITFIADSFVKIRVFQDWDLGPNAPMRLPQPADLPSDNLLEDARNLALVVADIEFAGRAAELGKYLELANPNYTALQTRTLGGTIQLYLKEEGLSSPTPATRLSQGTLQLLCLLAVLLHPSPPRLVCIEEPERGLHPDLLPDIAKLLQAAAERMQLIVTTHSEILVDALTEEPESILVCEKEERSTTLRRLNSRQLKRWLKDHKLLGSLWRSGLIGGNRW